MHLPCPILFSHLVDPFFPLFLHSFSTKFFFRVFCPRPCFSELPWPRPLCPRPPQSSPSRELERLLDKCLTLPCFSHLPVPFIKDFSLRFRLAARRSSLALLPPLPCIIFYKRLFSCMRTHLPDLSSQVCAWATGVLVGHGCTAVALIIVTNHIREEGVHGLNFIPKWVSRRQHSGSSLWDKNHNSWPALPLTDVLPHFFTYVFSGF